MPITPIQAMEAVEVITLPSLEVSQEDVESRNRRINMHRFMHGHHPQDEGYTMFLRIATLPYVAKR